MSKKNPEYDFKWCPGCGDFGVRRALEMAMIDRLEESGQPAENNVVIAGIGCSGNLIHLLEGAQPYGFHGIHGRSLPISLGVKMARPELNYQGQFSSILRSLGVKAESITQYTGLPFKVRDLVNQVTEMANACRREMVRA